MKKANSNSHPDHGIHKKRLNRIKGQIEGISKMIEERRYCLDILTQLRAAAKALQSVEAEITETHIHSCVKTAIKSQNEKEADQMIEEIMTLVKR